MTEEIKNEIRTHFENKEYDDVVKMINTKIKVDESNYKVILGETLSILNSIRINRDISYHEDYIEIERKFALYFTEKIYSYFILNCESKEIKDEVFGDCAKFFNAVNSITSIASSVFSDGGNEPIK